MCRRIFGSLIIFFIAILPVLSFASTGSETLVNEGRQLLFKNGNPTYQGIIDANEKFKDAVAADAADQEAHLFYAVTRIVSFILQTSDQGSFETIADIVQAMGIPIHLDELIENDAPFGEPPELADQYNPPETLPDGDDVRNVLSLGLVDVIDQALADLDSITDSINVILTAQEIDDLTDIQVDYTDVLLARAFLNAFKSIVLVISAYDLDGADIREIVALGNSGMMDLHPNMATELLTKYPNFLRLASNGATLLSTAKIAFQTAYTILSQAHTALNQELDNLENQDFDLFTYESEGDEQEFENILAGFSELIDSLAENRPATSQDTKHRWNITLDNTETLSFTLKEDIFGNGSNSRRESWFSDSINSQYIYGHITYWKITDNNIKIILTFWGNKRIELNGTLTNGDTTINTGEWSFLEYDGSGYTETENGTFSGIQISQDDFETDRFDLNALFGNTGKSMLDIRNSLPEFDVFSEPKPGTFPEPVFNGLFPDVVDNLTLNEELELDAPYKVFSIPITSSTVAGGDPSTWPVEFLVNTDTEDDFFPEWPEVQGMNIINTYLAKDNDNLYVAMELLIAPMTSYGGTSVNYNFELRKNEGDWNRNTIQINAYYAQWAQVPEWQVNVAERDSNGNYQHIVTLNSDNISVEGSFIKWKVPLSYFETSVPTLKTYGGQWITFGTWNEAIHDGDWVDSNTKLAPVYTITGSVTVPAGYAGGKIYLYLSDTQDLSNVNDAILGTYLEGAGSFTLADAPYSAAPLYLHVLWDTDGNGIINSGDYTGMTSFTIENNVDVGTIDSEILIPPPLLPIDAVSVKSVHSGDNQFRTFFEVVIGQGFSDNLPDDIATITITYPDGTNHQMYPDAGTEWLPEWNDFFLEMPGNPQLGEYVFVVTGKDGSVGVKSDIQKDLITIPIVDINKVKIDTGSKTPLFSWDPVSAPGTGITYRLEISDMAGNRLFWTGRDWNMTSCALPELPLQPGVQYQYRIRAMDDSDWIQMDNRSHTNWTTFTMDNTLFHAAVPAIDLDGWGAVEYGSSNSFNGFDAWIKIIDHDGVAYNGSSHTVSAVFLDASENTLGETPLNFQYAKNGILGFYSTWINTDTVNALSEFPTAIKFKVTDLDGIVGSVTDVITGQPLTPPGDTALSCTVVGTTPKFSWTAIPGANHYRVRIYDENFNTVWRGYPGNVASYNLPPGVLEPDTTYRYKLDARDAHSSFDTDHNLTVPDGDRENYPSFRTGARVDDPFIDARSNGVSTWSEKYRGTVTSYWIKVYDAQGVPGNIQSVKVIHPDGTTETQLYYEYNESSNCAIYSNNSYETQQDGTTYTFVAKDKDGNEYSMEEELTVNPMGYPAESSLSVVVNETGAEFDWDDVPEAGFYRLEIYNTKHERIFKFVTTESNYSLAPGFLAKGELYGFRVTTRREFWDQNQDNGSSSPWSSDWAINFKTEPVMDNGSNLPGIDTDNFGAAIIYLEHPVTGDPFYWLQFSVNVTDQDGVPGNIKSVTVQGPGITGSLTLNYGSPREENTAEYWNTIMYDLYDDIPEGTYTFTIEDEDGNIATTTDMLVKEPVPLVPYILPVDGAVISSDTPVIDWADPAGGSYFYSVRIYQHWHNLIHKSGILDISSYGVPAGILKPGELYGYRIHTYDNNPETADVDNYSINQLHFAKQNHFTILDGPPPSWTLSDIFRLMNLLIGNTSDISSFEGDINEDGKLNMQDIVPMLQEAGDLR